MNYRIAAQVEHYVDWQGAGTNKEEGAHSVLIHQTGEPIEINLCVRGVRADLSVKSTDAIEDLRAL